MGLHGEVVVAGDGDSEFLAPLHRRIHARGKDFWIVIEGRAVEYFDSAFIAQVLLAITVLGVAEVAGIVDVEFVRIVEQDAPGVRNVAVVVLGPAQHAAGGHYGRRNSLAHHESGDVGLVDHQVGGDTAGIVPIQTPLAVAMGVERLLRRRPQELLPIGVLRGEGRVERVAPGGRAARQSVAVPERPDVVAVANNSL